MESALELCPDGLYRDAGDGRWEAPGGVPGARLVVLHPLCQRVHITAGGDVPFDPEHPFACTSCVTRYRCLTAEQR
jgi:hypothetical protein